MKKIVPITCLLIIVFLVLAFINYRYLNIGFLSIYSIDEYAFHGSLLNMYEGLIAHDIKKLFSFGFYSYGFGFFFLNLLATAPFIATDNIEMSIYIPRIITSLFAVGSFGFIYKIARLYVDKYSSVLISLVVLTMPGFWKNAMWFHPDWMMTFFIILSIYLFGKDDWNFKKYFWWASIALGFAFATKIQAITFLPFVFIYVFYDNFKFKNFDAVKFKIKMLTKFVALLIATFIISNPYLIHPAGLRAFAKSFVLNMKSNATNHGLDVKVTIGDKIANAIDSYYLNTFLFLFLFFFSIFVFLLIFNKEKRKSILNVIGAYFIINIFYLFLMVNKDWQHYYLTVFIVAPLLLLVFVDKLSKYKYYLISGIILLQIGTHLLEYKKIFTTGYHPEYEMTVAKQNEMSNIIINDLKFVIHKKSNILISPYQPFDYRSLGLNYNNISIIYGPISKEMFDLDSFLKISKSNDQSKFKQIDFIILSKNDVYFVKEKLKKRVDIDGYKKAVKIIENFDKRGDLGYEKFSENKYFYIWRQKK
ncbi:glycosyltransferase family 39 protein [Flavobacterium gawalongense]|uniref:Glycosyltransferase family 39 protein n=1 Tax=Flavobacterium gawalongense TaxID=2594432 RepID=A0A553BYU4_9FLAO|nr:glycosyltransferase family 39 protein [Flavobacterium gawalongense]TRX13404.1 glycosyltransferase family 39 protein [Flavobacterium gawalongense]TRX15666.1 glycosyltransferase family 39 protein [Flavobacterium gawalongense]TRX31504.1 glycosyltransferase family 39 protein [Flavobacterium gawalongense]